MKADEEWRELEEKVSGAHPQYKVKPGASCQLNLWLEKSCPQLDTCRWLDVTYITVTQRNC